MTSNLEKIILVAAIFTLNLELVLCVCGRAEYERNGECCLMCAPGNRVSTHCTGDSSTICVPCVDRTYTAEPNGQGKCSICSLCPLGYGLQIKTQCTSTSDTVCEPLDGFYCIDQVRGICIRAVKHKTCSPGQYIKEKGTALTDTVCDSCPAGTYSNGSQQTCLPHSKCEGLGLEEIKPGTSSSDTECEKKIPVFLIPGVIVPVVAVFVVVAWRMFLKKKHIAIADTSVCAGKDALHSVTSDNTVRSEDNKHAITPTSQTNLLSTDSTIEVRSLQDCSDGGKGCDPEQCGLNLSDQNLDYCSHMPINSLYLQDFPRRGKGLVK